MSSESDSGTNDTLQRKWWLSGVGNETFKEKGQTVLFVETYYNMCIACVELRNQILTLESLMHVQKACSLVYVCGWHSTADGVLIWCYSRYE